MDPGWDTCDSAWRRAGAIGAVVLIGFAVGCGLGDFDAPLVNGYRLVAADSNTVVVVSAGGRSVVPPMVVELDVRGPVIFGRAELVASVQDASVGGYFVVDTRNGQTQTGMTETQWLTALSEHGMVGRPALRKIGDFDNSIIQEVAGAVCPVVSIGLGACMLWLLMRRRRRVAMP